MAPLRPNNNQYPRYKPARTKLRSQVVVANFMKFSASPLNKNGSDQHTKKSIKMSAKHCFVCSDEMRINSKLTSQIVTGDINTQYKPVIIECPTCGLRQLDPMLGEDDYVAVYSNSYFSASSGNAIGAMYDQHREQRFAMYRPRLDRLARLVPPGARLMDIGAGEGDFLSLARDTYSVSGIEFSEHGVRAAKERYNLDLIQGGADKLSSVPEQLDVIHLHHVFEHLLNPSAFLQLAHDKLTQDGLLVIEVPNQFNSLIDRIKSAVGRPHISHGLHAIHHPYFYSVESLRRLLPKHGFQILHLTTSLPDRRKVGADNLSKALARQLIYPIEKIFELGQIIEVICRKT